MSVVRFERAIASSLLVGEGEVALLVWCARFGVDARAGDCARKGKRERGTGNGERGTGNGGRGRGYQLEGEVALLVWCARAGGAMSVVRFERAIAFRTSLQVIVSFVPGRVGLEGVRNSGVRRRQVKLHPG